MRGGSLKQEAQLYRLLLKIQEIDNKIKIMEPSEEKHRLINQRNDLKIQMNDIKNGRKDLIKRYHADL